MPMALRSDVVRACQLDGKAKPVDLAHLSSLTMGDSMLEREVLAMFVAHADDYLAGLRRPGAVERREAAHLLKGAARGIGAWHLAEMAEAAEHRGLADASAFEAEISRVCAYIRSLD